MALVLVNPHAQGGRVRRRLPAIVQALHALTPLPRWQAPETLEEALDVLLHEPEGARVVLVGGDGTVNRYLPALLLRRLHMGLVPLGSGNDLARALGLNRHDWRAALADALHGRARPMDTGLVVYVTSLVLLAASLVDWDTTLLPDDFTLPLLWAGLLAAWMGWTVPAIRPSSRLA